jgi:hypothetical protein
MVIFELSKIYKIDFIDIKKLSYSRKLKDRLGKGGFGIVYQGKLNKLTDVAIKEY